jgi:hypothetical protein
MVEVVRPASLTTGLITIASWSYLEFLFSNWNRRGYLVVCWHLYPFSEVVHSNVSHQGRIVHLFYLCNSTTPSFYWFADTPLPDLLSLNVFLRPRQHAHRKGRFLLHAKITSTPLPAALSVSRRYLNAFLRSFLSIARLNNGHSESL